MSNTQSSPPSSHPHAQPLTGGCPVAHGKNMSAADLAASPHAHHHHYQQYHTGAAAAAGSNPHANPHANPLAGGCPVVHSSSSSSSSSATRSEPVASSHSRAAATHPFQYAKAQQHEGLTPEGEEVPPNTIPAAGRGNSADGKSWVNPSANQLYRALMRKDKPIDSGDAGAVAAVHVAVTENTWNCIMEYESLHTRACPNPTLARFQGMDGIYSLKAKAMMRLWGLRPFDRHDWYVNRCGKEVKYIIDYYSFETPDAATGETNIDYFIDARPAPTVAGLYDRARVAFQKWRRGEKIF